MQLPIVSPIRVTKQSGRYVFSCDAGEYGSLALADKGGRFEAPESMPVIIRQEPGITASHYQVWNVKNNQTSEFFASSYRWSIFRRDIRLHYGNNDYRLTPRSGWKLGYNLVDNRGKRILSFAPGNGGVEITVDKLETELACIVFAFFLVREVWLRSIWPAPEVIEQGDRKKAQDAATKAAEKQAESLAQSMMPGGVKKAGLESAPPKETAKSG